MIFSIRGLIKAGVMVAACNSAFAQQIVEFKQCESRDWIPPNLQRKSFLR